MTIRIRLLCGIAGLACASSAWAVTSWTLATTGSVSGSGGSLVTESTTGWANTSGSGADPTLYTLQQQTAPGNLALYSGGLGINNLDGCGTQANYCDLGDLQSVAPEHAIDNNQRNEMALLTFSQATKLTTATIGWTGDDADVSVMAWTGSGAPPSLTGAQWGALPSGWTTVGNYTGLNHNSSADQTLAINSQGTISSYWLIGAYNSLAAGNKDTAGVIMDTGSDFVKVKAVGGIVPEPGTLALLGLGFVGMLYRFRRRHLA